jgi:hypothetical protein
MWRPFFPEAARVCELGAFITTARNAETGGVTVTVEFHDKEHVCADDFPSGIAAAMFSQLILGAIQLHDPEAIIVIQHDRRITCRPKLPDDISWLAFADTVARL